MLGVMTAAMCRQWDGVEAAVEAEACARAEGRAKRGWSGPGGGEAATVGIKDGATEGVDGRFAATASRLWSGDGEVPGLSEPGARPRHTGPVVPRSRADGLVFLPK